MSFLDELFAKAKQDFNDANQTDTTGTYAKLAGVLTEVEAELREHVQRTTADEAQRILRKLENDEPIGPEELRVIKLWIVGDAESYVAVENNFQDWKDDVERIVAELGNVSGAALDWSEAARVRALVRDAIRSAWDIHYYLEHKERVESFDDSTRELDASGRKILARALRRKLSSPAY